MWKWESSFPMSHFVLLANTRGRARQAALAVNPCLAVCITISWYFNNLSATCKACYLTL